MDEPSIGLHQHDNSRLLKTLCRLRDLKNTIIIVEHDEEAIRAADHIVDMGPRAGIHGGKVVAHGTPEKIMRSSSSLTGQYLSGRREIPVPKKRRAFKHSLVVRGASANNLKGGDFGFPFGRAHLRHRRFRFRKIHIVARHFGARGGSQN